jgi:CheY-like chemotaxis protein
VIHRRFQEGLWPVKVDQSQINQVLMNLFINAWQAMPEGGDLSLRTENTVLDPEFCGPFQVPPGHYVKLTVTDTGTGMDRETLERAFEPFFTTKKAGKGTGLGLASAFGIVKNHGGIITIHSTPAKGSTFTVFLPASGKPVEERATIQPEVPPGRNETILLVDDEAKIIDIARQLLEKAGYAVLTADSGARAVEAVATHGERIALVILDLIMPRMSGAETLKRIRAMNPAIRVLLSSGHTFDHDVDALLEQGRTGFIAKPYTLQGLSLKIRELLDPC